MFCLIGYCSTGRQFFHSTNQMTGFYKSGWLSQNEVSIRCYNSKLIVGKWEKGGEGGGGGDAPSFLD